MGQGRRDNKMPVCWEDQMIKKKVLIVMLASVLILVGDINIKAKHET